MTICFILMAVAPMGEHKWHESNPMQAHKLPLVSRLSACNPVKSYHINICMSMRRLPLLMCHKLQVGLSRFHRDGISHAQGLLRCESLRLSVDRNDADSAEYPPWMPPWSRGSKLPSLQPEDVAGPHGLLAGLLGQV